MLWIMPFKTPQTNQPAQKPQTVQNNFVVNLPLYSFITSNPKQLLTEFTTKQNKNQ